MMLRYEEMRKERLEEAKSKEAVGQEPVLKSTTIFHGVQADYGQNKSFIDVPSYLRNKEHACFIPKKWLHTWVGHNKGV
jgi:pre-mRNA-processing factor 17